MQTISSIDPPDPLSTSFVFHPAQLSKLCSLRGITDPHEMFIQKCKSYRYETPNYFFDEDEGEDAYAYEYEYEYKDYDAQQVAIVEGREKRRMTKPSTPKQTPLCAISDSEEEDGEIIDEREGENSQVVERRQINTRRGTSRGSRRDSKRISLIRDDMQSCR